MEEQGFNFIAPDFKHGKNFKIGKFCIIGSGCVVGDDVTIENHTILHNNITIGNNNVVGSFCELGSNLKTGDNVTIQGRIRTGSNCTLENNVTIKYGTILTSKVLIKKDAFLGPNVITLGSTHKRETVHGTVIGERTYVGAGSKVAGGVQIGNDITTGALSFVNKDILESGIYVGVPVKKIK